MENIVDLVKTSKGVKYLEKSCFISKIKLKTLDQ